MGKSLIAIDDESAILDIILHVAGGLGFAAQSTTDPEEFKAMVRQDDPQLILMDLNMPSCDGIELLRYLFEQQSSAQVMLISGVDAKVLSVATHVGVELGLKMGKPLQKPIRVQQLRDCLAPFIAGTQEIGAAALRQGLERGEIELFYQPMIDLKRTRLAGWEALARWRHPELGVIAPDRFIPLAEAEGLMPSLTDRVMTLAMEEKAVWGCGGRLADGFISLNLSALDLVDPQIPDRLERLCERHGVPPGQVRLELTETVAMGESVRSVEVLTRLRVKGFRLAIDDFGTGYSSLVQLYRLPFSELKIDRTFVQNMTQSEEAAIIVKTILSLGHSLRLDLVAEGVENREIAELLTEEGCEIAQGYYYSRPVPPSDIARWCEGNPRLVA